MRGLRWSWIALVCVSACQWLPETKQTPPVTTAAPLSQPANTLPPGSWPLTSWWERYQDPTLNQLVTQALKEAPTLAQATARLSSASAQARANAAMNRWQVNAQAGITRQRQSDNGLVPIEFVGFNWYTQADLGVKASYHFDWWHKRRMRSDAGVFDVRAAQAEHLAAGISLSTAVVESYLGWQADQAQLALVTEQQVLLSRQQTLAAARIKAQVDNADGQYQLADQQAQLERQRLQWQYSAQLRRIMIAGLIGVSEDKLPAFTARPLLVPTATVPDELTVGLLAHRADIAAAYWRVKANEQQLGAARADFMPDISLNLMAGFSSIDLDKLLDAGSRTPGIGLALDLPLFDSGVLKARYGLRAAELDAAVADYNQAVVNAAQEVASSVLQLQRIAEQQQQQVQQQQAVTQLLDATQRRQQRGLTDLRPVLTAQRSVLEQRAQALAIQTELQLAELRLQVTLGGGYAAPLTLAQANAPTSP